MFYKAYNTFYAAVSRCSWSSCSKCRVLVPAAVSRPRLTARLDVKLSTYVFEKMLNLPIDYFEQNPVGLVSRDIREVFRIRGFRPASCSEPFSISDDAVLLPARHVLLQPAHDADGSSLCRDDRDLAHPDAACLSEEVLGDPGRPKVRRARS